uniref:Uncharacterized protein n=1 Tax=Arundo donax TaxID=35708 RepID=A0A0A9APB7_ARUDO
MVNCELYLFLDWHACHIILHNTMHTILFLCWHITQKATYCVSTTWCSGHQVTTIGTIETEVLDLVNCTRKNAQL